MLTQLDQRGVKRQAERPRARMPASAEATQGRLAGRRGRAAVAAFALSCVLVFGSSAGREAAAAQASKLPKEKHVVEMTVLIAGDAGGDSLVPGVPVRLDVVLRDRKGTQFATADGSLPFSSISVSGPHVGFNPALGLLTPERDRSVVGDGPYQVKVAYGTSKKAKVVTRELKADFAAVLGPEPAEVAEITFRIEAQEGAFLIPGRRYKVIFEARDSAGRVYRTGSIPALPSDRLVLSGEHVRWDERAGVVIPSDDRDTVGSGVYAVSVSYGGRPDLVVERQFQPDFAAVFGPEPAEVASLQVTLGGAKNIEAMAPGSQAKLRVSAVDRDGRTYATDGRDRKLPLSRLQVRATNLAYDSETATLSAAADCRTMLRKTYQVEIWYEGRKDLRETLVLEPDFVAPLASFRLPMPEMVFRGEMGRLGLGGEDGESGREGRMGYGEYSTGGRGNDGRPGRGGQPGGPGGPGPAVQVLAVDAESLDGAQRYAVMEIKVGSNPSFFTLQSSDAGAVSIVSQGGPGGGGGGGGEGGGGGRGGSGYNTGDGGSGGQGGVGGRGGPGGPGGQVAIVLGTDSLKYGVTAESFGGEGGRGGEPGAGGSSGKSGSAIQAVAATAGALLGALAGGTTVPSMPTPVLGSFGQRGMDGFAGEPGPDGQAGPVDIAVSRDAYNLIRRLPENMRNCLAFPSAKGY